ncbi:hypothetical protein P7M10_24600 [Vibrio parahaemolyticus]|nr:hypothetical protein [Vibrio parahaemolyticus]MDG2749280.1 hypothetical protein [Vibrio parahaemolyticus]
MMDNVTTSQAAIQWTPEDLASVQGGIKYSVSFSLLTGLLTWQV